jgi:DNA mismatch endonuclease Vsr
MQAVKNSGSKIEVALAKALWARGHRYRKNLKTVTGKPDICFKGRKVAVFVDGEFWHGKDWAQRKADHKSNVEFWHQKIERNMERDREVNAALKAAGWTVLRFWGKEVKTDLDRCVQLIEAALTKSEKK